MKTGEMIENYPELAELTDAEMAELLMAWRMKEATEDRPGSLWTEQELSSVDFGAQCEATIKRLCRDAVWRVAKGRAYTK